MVLQQSPAKACVTGMLIGGGKSVSINVTEDSQSYLVDAVMTKGSKYPGTQLWKACLLPHASGGNVSITAQCSADCPLTTNTTTLYEVTFGDVWYCSGQVCNESNNFIALYSHCALIFFYF